jgi:hypothetical protein
MEKVIYNPNNVDAAILPEILCFSNAGGGDGPAYAMAEDGTVLGSHWCSHEGFVPGDLGVIEGRRDDRHETYQQHYPNGYRMEFVRAEDIDGHAKLQSAFKLNQAEATTA